jgi:ABC-type multidrug transport system permease subunit
MWFFLGLAGVSYEIGEAFVMFFFFFFFFFYMDLVWRDEGEEREWIPIKLFNL